MLSKDSPPLTRISIYVVLADFHNTKFVFPMVKSCIMKSFHLLFPHFAYQKVQLDAIGSSKASQLFAPILLIQFWLLMLVIRTLWPWIPVCLFKVKSKSVSPSLCSQPIRRLSFSWPWTSYHMAFKTVQKKAPKQLRYNVTRSLEF